jgi:mono/diheme cytochrome c family protein
MKRLILILPILGVLLLLAALSAPAASAQMIPTPQSDRLAPWPTVDPPAQADSGAQEYYQRCMVCHGDRGQGLTAEWRGALDPADQNCWQSGCHNLRTVPGGFVFPKAVPPLIGGASLTHFGNAQNLFDYLKDNMPYQAPRSLPDDLYWQLTAYLVRANGFQAEPALGPENAASVLLVPPPPAPTIPVWVWPAAALAVVAAGLAALAFWRARRS